MLEGFLVTCQKMWLEFSDIFLSFLPTNAAWIPDSLRDETVL